MIEVIILALLSLMFLLLSLISFLIGEIRKNTDMLIVLGVSIMDSLDQEDYLQDKHYVN